MFRSAPPQVPMALMFAGIIPFASAAGSMLVWQNDLALMNTAALWLLVYSAVIFSFLGGVRWGAALTHPELLWRELGLAVLPSLWAAGALLLPRPDHSVLVLAAGFAIFGAMALRSVFPALLVLVPYASTALQMDGERKPASAGSPVLNRGLAVALVALVVVALASANPCLVRRSGL